MLRVLVATVFVFALRASAGERSTGPRFHAVLLNGGGEPMRNYQSHVLHLKELLRILDRANVPSSAITVFSSDGSDPGADVAVLRPVPVPGLWLLEGTAMGELFQTRVVLESSEIPGVEALPATRAALRRWFHRAAGSIRAGDTLLLYVTDHGGRNRRDPTNNKITLWNEESLTVRELRRLLVRLDPGVRIVSLMSQCYSGSFAHLGSPVEPQRPWCGYFSTTPERRAYGCYPEDRGRENVGHSFVFFRALPATGAFLDAHARVLSLDRTPDVPLRTTDVFLETLLGRRAEARGEPLERLVDRLLAADAWSSSVDAGRDLVLLGEVARAFGLPAPASIAEIERTRKEVRSWRTRLARRAEAWTATLDAARRTNLERFLSLHPEWNLSPASVEALGATERLQRRDDLVRRLRAHTRDDRGLHERLRRLRKNARTAAEIAERMRARDAALLRLRTLLIRIAGHAALAESRATASDGYERLRDCEDFRLELPERTEPPRADPFPRMSDDSAVAERTTPGWLGLRFRSLDEERRAAGGLPGGTVEVVEVLPDSPAAAAGVEAGDVISGPPGTPFTEPEQIREWTLSSPPGTPAPLRMRRDGRWDVRTVTPQSLP